MLCDTNILIYAGDPVDTRCSQFIARRDASISIVSRIEVLGYPGWGNLADERRSRLIQIVSSLIELRLDAQVVDRAILLRQQRKMSLGDSIIAATALTYKISACHSKC